MIYQLILYFSSVKGDTSVFEVWGIWPSHASLFCLHANTPSASQQIQVKVLWLKEPTEISVRKEPSVESLTWVYERKYRLLVRKYLCILYNCSVQVHIVHCFAKYVIYDINILSINIKHGHSFLRSSTRLLSLYRPSLDLIPLNLSSQEAF